MSRTDIDIEALLAAVSPEEPCGPNPEYDPEFVALENDAKGTEERVMGEKVIPAAEPDWSDIGSRCLAVLQRARDLRLVLLLTTAQTERYGLAGFCDSLQLLLGLLQCHWPHVHPQLDPEDDHDPTIRLNIIKGMAPEPGAMGDTLKFADRLRQIPLCQSRAAGSYGLRSIQLARGDLASADPEQQVPSQNVIDAAFDDTPSETLEQAAAELSEAIGLVEQIDAFLVEKVGAEHGIDFDSLLGVLGEMQRVLNGYLAGRGLPTQGPIEDAADTTAAARRASPVSEVNNKEDVLLAIDRICRYYECSEPSSPVPLLLKRARRLVNKSFSQIIADLTPDAVRQVEMIAGAPDELSQDDT